MCLERLEVLAEVVLADVERGAPGPRALGQCVRDVELLQGDAADDRARTCAVVVADVVEDEPLTRVVADPKAPAEPADRLARAGEARPVRLDDLERLEAAARRVGRPSPSRACTPVERT